MSSKTSGVGVIGAQPSTTPEGNGPDRLNPGIDTLNDDKTNKDDAKAEFKYHHHDQDVEAAEALAKHEHVEEGELQRTITLDTVHHDEAIRVLDAYEGDRTWTEQEEKKLVRKIDRQLLSIVVTTYGLQYYDKAMLAQAVREVQHSYPGGK